MLYFDVDYFKFINDMWGYVVGDDVFVVLFDVLVGVLCLVDLFGCLGGDEFVVLLLGCGLIGVFVVVEWFKMVVVGM